MSECRCSGKVRGESPPPRFPNERPWTALLAFAVSIFLPCRVVEARGQTTPQVQIYDAGPGTNPAPASTDSARRLLELVSKQQWSETANLGQELVRQQPADPEVSYYLGIAFVHLDEPMAAIRALRAAERLGMNSAAFHQALGIAYYNLHQFILFQEQMEKSMALAPADYKPYYYVGRYFESVYGDFPSALRYFAKAAALNPELAKSWYYEGYCLEASGRTTEARSAFETAIKIVETTHEPFSPPYQGIARLLAYDDPSQALEFARKALQLEPNLD
jgi:tetratricopeptide (TPR) repeat protein